MARSDARLSIAGPSQRAGAFSKPLPVYVLPYVGKLPGFAVEFWRMSLARID